jgi:hypothetical protein
MLQKRLLSGRQMIRRLSFCGTSSAATFNINLPAGGTGGPGCVRRYCLQLTAGELAVR